MFSSDKFSNYILAHEDTADVKNPVTLNDGVTYVVTGVLSVVAIIGDMYIIRKGCK